MNTKQLKRIFAFVLIFFLLGSGVSLFTDFVYAAGTKDYRQVGVDPARTTYSELAPDKDESPFVYDDNLDLKQSEVESFLSGTTVRFHNMNGSVTNGNGTTGTVVFSNLSQETLLHNNKIYASIGFVYGGSSYSGILPLKVVQKGNEFYYEPFASAIDVFQTKKSYYGVNGGTSTPVAPPVILEDDTTMVYFVSQWFIKYKINSNGLAYERSKQVLHNNAYPSIQYSFGGPPIEDPSINRVFVGSWNGHVYKVNPYDLSYTSLNVRKFDVYDSASQTMINAGRISATPSIATKGGTKRVIFGITTNDGTKNASGGICSANDSLGDVKCTIERYYYSFSSTGSRNSYSTITTSSGTPVEVEAVVDVSPAWDTKNGYGYVPDRKGNFYAYNINGKVRYKNTSFKGSLVWASTSIDKEHKYSYMAVQSLRSGTNENTFGSSLYSSNECNSGRIARFDLNDIAYDLNNTSYGVIHSQLRNYDLKSSSDFGGANYIYSHGKWLTPNEVTGIPFVMGRSIVQSMTGCSSDGQVGKMFALNGWYDASSTKPITNTALRENINTSSNGGTLNFLMDTSNQSWYNVYSMGKFAGPTAGFNFSPYHDEGITINSGRGLTVVYIQNSDFDIVDLSVKTHETDGKFYQIDPAKDNPTEIYEGHVRVVTSPKKRLSIPKAVYDNPNSKLRISVFHTNNPASSSKDNLVCGDPYGKEPCKYINKSIAPTSYTATNLKNNSGNATNYSKSYRELYRFDIPVQSLPVKTVKDSQGGISYVIEPGTSILDKNFDVFKHNYSGSATQTHHLIASVDMNNTIREKDESYLDNMVYRPIVYGGKGVEKPDLDLACTIQKPSGQYYKVGQDYNLNLAIQNTSKEKYIDMDFDYLVKLNGSVTQRGVVRVNTFPGSDGLLQAGEKINLPLKLRLPASANYKVEVDLNSTRFSGPLLEGNNFNNNCEYDVSSAYPSASPDLASIAVGPTSKIYKFKFDASGNALNANPIQINGVVQNLGFKRIETNTKTKMYVYYKNTLLNGGKPITSDCFAILGTNATCATGYTLKSNEIKQGVYTVKLIADSTNNLVESNEYNNTRTTYFFIDKVDVGVPNNHFSPNGGGIKDKAAMSLSSGNLSAPSYTYKMELGIFDKDGNLIKPLKTSSTSFRYPGVGKSVYYSSPISSYSGSYLSSSTASGLWSSVPKTSGTYMWDGFSNRSGAATTEKDGLYRIGIRYHYEIPNPNYVYKWTTGGCYYYNSAGTKVNYDCYLPDYNNSKYLTSKTGTITSYGTEIILDNTLEIYNVELKNLNNIRSGSYLQFEKIQTRLEASQVWLEIPKNLIILDGFKTTNVTTVGNYYKVPLVPKWSTYYKSSDTFRCNADPYCNQWNIATGDGIILSQNATDGNHEIRVVAITRTDTPNSPKMEILNIQLGDSYDKHIKINENQN